MKRGGGAVCKTENLFNHGHVFQLRRGSSRQFHWLKGKDISKETKQLHEKTRNSEAGEVIQPTCRTG